MTTSPQRKLLPFLNARTVLRNIINFWGPFLGSSIKVVDVNKDVTRIRVELRQKWYNRNIVGVHFGGSLYSMCDPFYMAILMNFLGEEYTVWDKAASIRFIKPGRGTVHAVFEIPSNVLEEIKKDVDTKGKCEYVFTAIVKNSDEIHVAEVQKTLWLRKNSAKK